MHDKNNKPIHHYYRCSRGRFYRNTKSDVHAHTLVNIVTSNGSNFIARDIIRAKEARKLQQLMGLSLNGLMEEIYPGGRQMHIHCNAEILKVTQVEDL